MKTFPPLVNYIQNGGQATLAQVSRALSVLRVSTIGDV